MNYLLDTHTLLWWLDNNPSLSQSASNMIADSNNIIFVSPVSAWEMSIKKALGKLDIPDDLETAIKVNNFKIIAINIADGLLAGQLPNYHNDPFDRMLIAQAINHNLTIITRDSKFKQYGVNIVVA